MSSIDPLVLGYSFNANRAQATDKVDLAQLDAALNTIADKLNEIVAALDVTTRDDDTLRDGILKPEHMNPELADELAAQVNEATNAALGLTA